MLNRHVIFLLQSFLPTRLSENDAFSAVNSNHYSMLIMATNLSKDTFAENVLKQVWHENLTAQKQDRPQ